MEELTRNNTALANRIAVSVQNWYSTYYLPSDVYATTMTDEEVSNALKSGSIPWLSNGYLLVNFKVTAVNAGTEHLEYNSAALNETQSDEEIDSEESESARVAGSCNMWKVEGFATTKLDSEAKEFKFEYGDFLLFDLDAGGAGNDYSSGGTQ